MPRIELLPPDLPPLPDGARVGGWWRETEEPGRLLCELCPRACLLRPGDRGFCFVRENRAGEMVLSTYGRSTGFCIDPIEKKPLNQFYPGTSVLSFGTAGCNLGCKFCQNWSISKSKEVESLSETASPSAIARAAQHFGCHSVAFTYNDPVVWAEYAIDAAQACRAQGVKTVAVTAGYISPAARGPFYAVMDAANVDLKGFTEAFYQKLTLSHLQPVLDTLQYIHRETSCWLEITNLLIPQANDSPDELQQMCDWLLAHVGPDVPVHFTAFHPDFRLNDRPPTPVETLLTAYDIARRAGLNYVYVGNVAAPAQQATYCPKCRTPLIERVGYEIRGYRLHGDRCQRCNHRIAGRYAERPGAWGNRRQPVRIAAFAPPTENAAPLPAPLLTIERPTLAMLNLAQLSDHDRAQIARFAAEALQTAVTGRLAPTPATDLRWAGQPVLGAFVSAKRRGVLRSCCGFIGQPQPLAVGLAHAAQRTACDDARFPPIAPRELPALELEIWLLSNSQPITARGAARKDGVVIGKHGLTIALGEARGLLLPGVAVEHQLDAEGFLRQVCKKAGLPPTAWLDDAAQLTTFEGLAIPYSFAAGEGSGGKPPAVASEPPLVSSDELAALAEFTRTNLLAFLTGATPSYFAFGVSDANVQGAVAEVYNAEGRLIAQSHRFALRETMPLQSTLFGLAQSLASVVAQQTPRVNWEELEVGLLILGPAAVQGTAAEPDLRGLDPRKHAVIVMERNRSAVVYDRVLAPCDLIEEAVRSAGLRHPAATLAYSAAAVSTASRVVAAQTPQPQAGPATRPPGVAGKFYPATAAELNPLLDQCLSGEPVTPAAWPAAMLPHAGLVYSGRIAGSVLRRLQIPPLVIILGPKHTPHGVEWAVAPHAVWRLPTGELRSDQALARALCEAIPGLELDAAAHAQEHAIEVELPLLHRLAPECRVVGVALGAADWPQCQKFARGLAEVIRTLPEPPLLLISSDLNHFAADAENRRLDELALAALDTRDPQHLLSVVREHEISMCGVVPAAIVLETLRLLGRLSRTERVAYATSGDTTGDRSRVVGYAGVLLG